MAACTAAIFINPPPLIQKCKPAYLLYKRLAGNATADTRPSIRKLLEITVFLCYSSIETTGMGGTEHGKGEENECYAHSGQA